MILKVLLEEKRVNSARRRWAKRCYGNFNRSLLSVAHSDADMFGLETVQESSKRLPKLQKYDETARQPNDATHSPEEEGS